ncbi:MAG: helix-hairpin-helix domain-containing protein [Clostridia bacterium]|nr:helix-hairpin-helix domain-containing protein [Clostridia bacterium]
MVLNIFGREIFVNKGILALILIVLVAVLGTTGYAVSKKSHSIIIQKEEEKEIEAKAAFKATEDAKTSEKSEKAVEPQAEEIKIYVVGCVKSPGIVALKKGQLIFDAINAAGGATEEADLENVNMAYKLQENVMIRILSKKDTVESSKNPPAAIKTASSTSKTPLKGTQESKDQKAAGKAIEIIADSKGAVAGEAAAGETGGKVNINTASVDQLDSLPGIGVETAKDIISYREKNGGFKKPEDIMKISGIKTSKFNKIKDRITVN